MKKIISSVCILLFILAVFSFSVSAAEIKDISEDHWAYKSVQKLVDRGYLNLYEDDTFKGENKVSRYELATILARMLDDLQTNEVEITEDDTDQLRKLSLEFRDELVEIAKKQEDIFSSIESNKEKNVIQTETIGKNREMINNIVATINELKKLSNEVDKLNKDLKEQSLTIKNLEKKLQENDQDISKINDNLSNIGSNLGNQEAIQDIQDQQDVTVTNVNSLNSKVNSLNKKIENQDVRIKELKNKNEQQRMYFIALAAAILIVP